MIDTAAPAQHHPRRHRLGFVVTAVLLALAAGVFVGLRGAVRDLDCSLAALYDRTNFAGLTVTGGDTEAFATTAADTPGVTTVQRRDTATLSVWLHGGRQKLEGTILGVPPDGPAVDGLVVTAGREFAPATTDAVAVVEQHTADDLDVHVGDTVTALGTGTQLELRVVGIALSPEYLLPAQSQQQIVSARGSFAVLFVLDAIATQLGGATTISQVHVAYRAGADTDALDAQLTRAADRAGAQLVETRATQPSNAVLHEERTGFVEASIVIPLLAFVTALFVGAVACARVEDARRRRRALARTTLVGAVTGVVLGLVSAAIVGPELTDSVSIPTHVGASHLLPALGALALSALVGLIALGLGTVLARATGSSLGWGPAAVSAFAAAAAMTVVIGPVGVVDSARATLDAAGRRERVDAQVAFATPATPAELATLRAVPGVAAAEPVPSANVFVRHGTARHGTRYATQLEAFRADTTMQRFETPPGASLALPARGVVIPESLGQILHARVGDELEVTFPGAGVQTLRVPVTAFTSDTLGNLVFLRISTLRAALGPDADAFAGGLFDTATMRFAPATDTEGAARIARAVQAEPSVVVYVPVGADLGSVAAARPIFAAIVDALLALGVVVAALGVGSAVLLHAHTRARHGRARLALEVLVALAVGIVLGAIGGTALANRLVAALDTALVHLVYEIDPATYLLAASLVLVAGVVAAVVGGARAGATSEPVSSGVDGRGGPPGSAAGAGRRRVPPDR